jgi:hypothetical protein
MRTRSDRGMKRLRTNNLYGRKGVPRCAQCRNIHRPVSRQKKLLITCSVYTCLSGFHATFAKHEIFKSLASRYTVRRQRPIYLFPDRSPRKSTPSSSQKTCCSCSTLTHGRTISFGNSFTHSGMNMGKALAIFLCDRQCWPWLLFSFLEKPPNRCYKITVTTHTRS